MQLHNENNQLITNLKTQAKTFTIHASAKAFRLLSSNLYKYKISAIIRELSCNALDSHIDAGTTDPFVIHLPTQIEPYFAIEDFGTGMTPEQIEELYTGYFASSKTERNDQIGALGLGSKSPFAYTDMFTIDSVRDGVKSTYSAFLDQAGMPTYMLVKSEKTTQHSGVRITFPVPEGDFGEFAVAAATILWPFDSNRPKITGVTKLFAEYTSDYNTSIPVLEGQSWKIYKKYPDVINRRYRYEAGAMVKMGNILYPISNLVSDQQFQDVVAYINIPLILEMPLGSCDISPSREELSYDQLTKDNIHKALVNTHKDLEKQASEKIGNAKTVWEAAKISREYFNTILPGYSSKIQFTYKGTTYTYGQWMTADAYAFICSYESSRRTDEMTIRVNNNSNPVGKLEVQLGHNVLLVLAGFKAIDSQYLRTRIRYYCKQQKMPETRIYIVSSISQEDLVALGNPPVVRYEDLPKAGYQRTQAPVGKIRSYYNNNEVDITTLSGRNIYIIDYCKRFAIGENYKGITAKTYSKKNNDQVNYTFRRLFRVIPETIQKKIYIVPYKIFDEFELAKNKNWMSFETVIRNACAMFIKRYKNVYITSGGEEETISFYDGILRHQFEFEKAGLADGSPMKAGLELLKTFKASATTNANTYETAKTVFEIMSRIDQYFDLKLGLDAIVQARNPERKIDMIRIFHNYPMLAYMLRGNRYTYLNLDSNTLRIDIGSPQMDNVDSEHQKAILDVIEYVKMVDKSNGIE